MVDAELTPTRRCVFYEERYERLLPQKPPAHLLWWEIVWAVSQLLVVPCFILALGWVREEWLWREALLGCAIELLLVVAFLLLIVLFDEDMRRHERFHNS